MDQQRLRSRTACAPLRIAACLLLAILLPLPNAQGDPAERSPFEMVRWVEDGPQVQVQGTWYELRALDGIPFSRVVAACRTLDARQWEKRFCEDLVAALATIGHKLGPQADLQVRLPGGSETKTLSSVPATSEKRRRIRDARPWKRAASKAVKRVSREHGTVVPPALAHLQLRHRNESRARLSAEEAHADLDQLEWHCRNEWSYLRLRDVDWPAAFDVIRGGIGETGIAREDFHIQLRKLIALGGDGHARVRGVARALPRGCLPFALAEADGHVAAVQENGTPYNAAFPYVVSLHGVPIERWLDTAARLNARGSAALQRQQSLQYGVFSSWLRSELKAEAPPSATLTNKAGDTQKVLWKEPRAAPVRYRGPPREAGPWAGRGNRYVRIAAMDSEPEFLNLIMQSALSSRRMKALVLDVRGNGGGSRRLLRALLPHLLPADATPTLCNLASYRLKPGERFDPVEGNLRNRFLYPGAWAGWSAAERKVTQVFEKPTQFARQLHNGPDFTPIHGMIVSPAAPAAPRFTGPIIVLIDGGCFSATDIFVGALETLPNVTLVGTPTGGGSGRSQQVRLAHSGLDVRLSTMVSYRPGGALYDTRGIEPDKLVPPALTDLSGESDTALEAAVRILKTKK